MEASVIMKVWSGLMVGNMACSNSPTRPPVMTPTPIDPMPNLRITAHMMAMNKMKKI